MKLLTFKIPEIEFERFEFNVSIVSLIRSYLLAIVEVNLNDPKIIIGIGINANVAIRGEIYKNVPPITITVVAVCNNLLAPVSRNLSSWFTSSLRIAINLPEDLFSKYFISRLKTFSNVSVLKLCSMSWEIPLHVTAER